MMFDSRYCDLIPDSFGLGGNRTPDGGLTVIVSVIPIRTVCSFDNDLW